MTMIKRLRILLLAAVGGLAPACVSPDITKDMGPQTFPDPPLESAGSADPGIATAVESAVTVANECGFHYDASGSQQGRVVVTALWKGDPVTFTMRFFRKEEQLCLADMTVFSGSTPFDKARRIGDLYYERLARETQLKGLQIQSDPNVAP
jgi:hypothetical protein